MHLVPLSLRMWKQVCEGAPSSSLALGLHEMQSGSRLITPVHGHAQARHTHRPLLWPYMIILKQFTSLKGTGRGSDACLQGRGGCLELPQQQTGEKGVVGTALPRQGSKGLLPVRLPEGLRRELGPAGASTSDLWPAEL